MQACERLGPAHKFDAVVVDEGQDFHELWWTSLESVFRDPHDKTCYYVFFDPNQNLYVQEPCLPEEFGQPYLLQENCRNTVRIATHCSATNRSPGTARRRGMSPRSCRRARSAMRSGRRAGACASFACPTWEG